MRSTARCWATLPKRTDSEADWVDVAWGDKTEGAVARIEVEVKNEPGVLGLLATVIGAHKANIINLRLDSRDTSVHTNVIDVEVHDLHQLMRLIAALARCRGRQRGRAGVATGGAPAMEPRTEPSACNLDDDDPRAPGYITRPMQRPALSIVIPCYNEADCLALLHAQRRRRRSKGRGGRGFRGPVHQRRQRATTAGR